MNKIDMHIHTKASDGILSPTQVVDWAYKKGLKGIAITDHDTLDGLEEGERASLNYEQFLFIPGIELGCLYKNYEVHILGYFINYHDQNLIDTSYTIKEYRIQRAKKMIQKLRQLGMNVSFDELDVKSSKKAIGRPHIARLLVRKGYAISIQDAFEKYLSKGKKAYVERFKLSIKEAIELIHHAKGIAVIAHPGLMNKEIEIDDIIQMGIDGIEVYHRKHTKEDMKKYLKIAIQYNLFITGGTDYHEESVKGVPIIGDYYINIEDILRMKNKKFEGILKKISNTINL